MKTSDREIGRNTSPARESNMELLRIVSMLMVVLVHLDGGCLGIPDLEGDWSRIDGRILWRMAVESFAFIGVNCFTLISGYFGIRLRLRGVASYLFQCIFYAVGIYLVAAFIDPRHFSCNGLLDSAMVLTHTDLWYVPAYFILMLVSPWINAGFEAMPRRRGLALTLAFTAFTLWAGWWWGGAFNAAGYTAWQLVMMYCIGRMIAAYKEELTTLRIRLSGSRSVFLWLGVYALCSLATVAIGIYDFRKAYSYNQPFVVMASVGFFLGFASLTLKSKIVNYAARSAFAVYLLHKSPLVWGRWLKPAVVHLWNATTLSEFTLYTLLIAGGIYLIAMAIDAVRRRLYGLLTFLWN